MQNGDTIHISAERPDWQSRLPGAAAFAENVDTYDDDSESADVLSFESLREAFAAIHSAEKELAQTIPQIEPSAQRLPDAPELPDYDINETLDPEKESQGLALHAESSISVGIRLETIIEAVLFVGNQENRPLNAGQIAEKLRNVSQDEVAQAVDRLNERYQQRNCPYTIIAEHGGYRMVLRSEFEPVRSNFYGKVREPRLSQQAIDVLAVVAYRQPITAEEIQDLRQESGSATLNQLVRRNLLSASRSVQNKRNIVRYSTTPRFLELLQIQSLDDIPKVDEWDYR